MRKTDRSEAAWAKTAAISEWPVVARDPAAVGTLQPDDATASPAGELVQGRYRLMNELGRGATGSVYVAKDVRLDRRVAVKISHETVDGALDAEVSAATRINHGNVNPVFDRGTLPTGQGYVVTALARGANLREVMEQERPVAWRRVVAWIEGIAAGLDEVHGHGLVHGDIKPENVVLRRLHDGTLQPLLIDFAFSVASGQPLQGLAGTPAYLAPERHGQTPATPGSDIYALGVLAFELLSGRNPFLRPRLGDCLAAHRAPVRPSLGRSPTGRWPDGLQGIFDRVLAIDPAQRPTSAKSFAAELRAALEPYWEPVGGAVCSACARTHVRRGGFCPDCGASAVAQRCARCDSELLDLTSTRCQRCSATLYPVRGQLPPPHRPKGPLLRRPRAVLTLDDSDHAAADSHFRFQTVVEAHGGWVPLDLGNLRVAIFETSARGETAAESALRAAQAFLRNRQVRGEGSDSATLGLEVGEAGTVGLGVRGGRFEAAGDAIRAAIALAIRRDCSTRLRLGGAAASLLAARHPLGHIDGVWTTQRRPVNADVMPETLSSALLVLEAVPDQRRLSLARTRSRADALWIASAWLSGGGYLLEAHGAPGCELPLAPLPALVRAAVEPSMSRTEFQARLVDAVSGDAQTKAQLVANVGDVLAALDWQTSHYIRHAQLFSGERLRQGLVAALEIGTHDQPLAIVLNHQPAASGPGIEALLHHLRKRAVDALVVVVGEGLEELAYDAIVKERQSASPTSTLDGGHGTNRDDDPADQPAAPAMYESLLTAVQVLGPEVPLGMLRELFGSQPIELPIEYGLAHGHLRIAPSDAYDGSPTASILTEGVPPNLHAAESRALHRRALDWLGRPSHRKSHTHAIRVARHHLGAGAPLAAAEHYLRAAVDVEFDDAAAARWAVRAAVTAITAADEQAVDPTLLAAVRVELQRARGRLEAVHGDPERGLAMLDALNGTGITLDTEDRLAQAEAHRKLNQCEARADCLRSALAQLPSDEPHHAIARVQIALHLAAALQIRGETASARRTLVMTRNALAYDARRSASDTLKADADADTDTVTAPATSVDPELSEALLLDAMQELEEMIATF